MQILDCEQLSDEWMKARIGSIGGSSISSVVAGGQGKMRKNDPPFYKVRQTRLFYTGRSHRVGIKDYSLPKYTRQKKFRTGIFLDGKAKN